MKYHGVDLKFLPLESGVDARDAFVVGICVGIMIGVILGAIFYG